MSWFSLLELHLIIIQTRDSLEGGLGEVGHEVDMGLAPAQLIKTGGIEPVIETNLNSNI
jgi:hypothetical protein